MNTPTHTAAHTVASTVAHSPTPAYTTPLQASTSARVAGAGFALVLTLAMLLGVDTLASVDAQAAQMAKAQPAASSAQT